MLENLFLITFLASVLVVHKSTTSTPIQNDLMEVMMIRLDSLQVKMDLLGARNVENELKISKQDEEIIKLKAEIEAKLKWPDNYHSAGPHNNELHIHSIADNNNNTGIINRKENPLGDGDSLATSRAAIAPSSCKDLSQIGHSFDGLYLVQNPSTNKIETVLCNFGNSNAAVSQKLIGNMDVRTRSVHFYVQRNSTLSTTGVVHFDMARLNEGGAMDMDTGIFTAPVAGIYHFEFSATKPPSSKYLNIFLEATGVIIGNAYTYHNDTENYDSVSLSASLRLKAKDFVNLYNNYESEIFDARFHNTHFTGWLVEEDLM